MTTPEIIKQAQEIAAQATKNNELMAEIRERMASLEEKTRGLDQVYSLGVRLIESGQNLVLPPDSPPYVSTTVALLLVKNTYGKAMHDVLMALFKDDFSFLEKALEETVIQWREPTQAEIAAEMWLEEEGIPDC